MPKPIVIDAHEDMGYNFINFGRDYRESAAAIRRRESAETGRVDGHAQMGWDEYQAGRVALIFSTLFATPERAKADEGDRYIYKTAEEARKIYRLQLDYYQKLCDSGKFRQVATRRDLAAVLKPWQEEGDFPQVERPIGLVYLIEGAETLGDVRELEEYYQLGVRIVGPVWDGGRYCGGTIEHIHFTPEGFELLKVMESLNMALDISHMDGRSGLEAMDHYSGTVIASHSNARHCVYDGRIPAELPAGTLSLNSDDGLAERHLTDQAIRKLAEHDGVIGILPYNRFLKAGWHRGDPRLAMDVIVEHMDHICQVTGSARHIGYGTDFDGGWGWPWAPVGIDTVADLKDISPLLKARGYSDEDVNGILGGNWLRMLEKTLPA